MQHELFSNLTEGVQIALTDGVTEFAEPETSQPDINIMRAVAAQRPVPQPKPQRHRPPPPISMQSRTPSKRNVSRLRLLPKTSVLSSSMPASWWESKHTADELRNICRVFGIRQAGTAREMADNIEFGVPGRAAIRAGIYGKDDHVVFKVNMRYSFPPTESLDVISVEQPRAVPALQNAMEARTRLRKRERNHRLLNTHTSNLTENR